LNYASTSSLSANGGTVKDSFGNNATLTLPATGAANSLAGTKDIILDNEYTATSSPAQVTANTSQAFTITLTNTTHSFDMAQRVKIAIPNGWTISDGAGLGGSSVTAVP